MNTSHPRVAQTFKNLIDKTELTESALRALAFPARVHTFNIPFKRNNGEIQNIKGFRIQYNDNLGPTKGGLRYHPGVDQAEVTELSYLMAIKTAAVNLPYGGGKGGLQIDPKNYSKDELEKLSRQFMRSLAKHIGPNYDIPAPDVNTTPEIMGWLRDEYEQIVGKDSPAIITGKSIDEGGSFGRTEATGRGGFIILDALIKDLGKVTSQVNIAMQGFGNVGQYFAKFANQAGYKVVAVSDSSTGLYNEDGLDIDELIEFKNSGNRFIDYRNADKLSNEELLELSVDVLAPAALGGVIHHSNHADVQAQIIIELANGPIETEVEPDLLNTGKIIIPGTLANAGGVTVSYYEWLQNMQNKSWSLEEVRQKLHDQLTNAYTEIKSVVDEKQIDWRTATDYVAIKRILNL